MNQVTVVEVIDPTDRYTITGMGYGLDGEVQHTAGNTNTIEAAILPFLITNDAKLVDGKVVGDPTEGALLVLGPQGEARHRRHAGGLPAARHAAVRPDLQADGRLLRRQGRGGQRRRPGLRQGCRAGRDRSGHVGPRQGRVHRRGASSRTSAPTQEMQRLGSRACGSWPRRRRTSTRASFDPDGRPARPWSRACS